MSDDTKATWKDLAKQVLSFIIGAVVAIFILGKREEKINDVVSWKVETAPRIERMDNLGSHSFAYFKEEYERTQSRQEAKVKELETELHQFEREKK